jgi:hypothetical protein
MLTLANMVVGGLTDVDGVSVVLLLGGCTFVLGFWVRSLLRIEVAWALLFALAISGAVAWWLLANGLGDAADVRMMRSEPANRNFQEMLIIACACATATLGLGLLIKLYRAAVLDKATPQERLPGLAGVRAWLRPLNAVTVVVLAVTAAQAIEWNYFGVFIAGICLLLAYPIFVSFQQSPTSDTTGPGAPASQAAPEERQRVLALVESGKITAEDGAELLTALAQSQAAGNESAAAISRPRRLMVLGATVLLVGFFLPWFTENITEQMSAMMNNVQQAMPQFAQVPAGMQPSVPVPTNTVNHIILRGGDVRNGLGWIALATGILAATLPFFWSERSTDQKPVRNVTLVALGVGTIALLYLLSNSFNPVTTVEPGFIVAMAGYVLLWIGGVRDYGVIRPRVGAALATA